MLQRPRATVVGVPPCARTMPAARLLAPSPARPRSRTMTRSAPDRRAKYEAQPPTVPAPTMTRPARSSLISPLLAANYRQSGGNGRSGFDLPAAVAATPDQAEKEELASPAGVDDGGADVGTDGALALQDVQRVGPGVERGMEEQDEQQAASGAVIQPGRNDGERDRADGEERKWQMALCRAVDQEQRNVPEGGDHADCHDCAEH